MFRTMKKNIIALFAFVAFFLSCSKDGEYEEPLVSEESIEVYKQVFDAVYSYTGGPVAVDMESTINYIKNLDGVVNIVVQDSIIKVTTRGNVQFSIDYNTYPDYEIGNVNFTALQQYEDSINNIVGALPTGYEQTCEVFKDFISNYISYGSNANTTTRSSSNMSVRLARRNFVIWSPYNRSDFTKEKDNVMNVVKRKTNLCSYTTRFSPASFTDLAAFDVVYMSSHGCKDGSFFLPAEYLSSSDMNEYEKEVAAKRTEKSIRRIGDTRVKGYSLKKTFFDKYLSDLGHTVVYTSACYFGAENSLFMKCCKDKNVADYFGSDNACIGADVLNSFVEFYPKLMNGYSTKMAFNNGKSSFTGALLRGKALETYKFKRFGEKQVGYVMPHATGTGNRSNASKAQTRSDSSSASSTVVNAQLRYATEESGDILKTIEAGICLQDMETKQITFIPFNNENILSNEKKTYGEVTVIDIATSLDNLTEGHQYAYCCYTKANGEITLSDETYKFSNKSNYTLVLKYSWTTKLTHYSRKYGTKIEDQTSSHDIDSIAITKWDGIYDLRPFSQRDFYWYDLDGHGYIEIGNNFTIGNLIIGNYTKEYGQKEGFTNSVLSVNIYGDNIRIKYSYDVPPGSIYQYWHHEKEFTMNHLDTTPELVIREEHYKGGSNSKDTFRYDYEYNYSFLGWYRY